jgi:hypothetical protein
MDKQEYILKKAENVDKVINNLNLVIRKAENDNMIKAYEYELSEVIPVVKSVCKNIDDTGISVFSYVFSKCMNDGNDIAKSFDVAKSLTIKSWDSSKIEVLKTVESILKDIMSLKKGELIGDGADEEGSLGEPDETDDSEVVPGGADDEDSFDVKKSIEWSDGSVTKQLVPQDK